MKLKPKENITKANAFMFLWISILFLSCRTNTYQTISGEYVMDFSGRYLEQKWTLDLDDSGGFVLTEPGIGLLRPDTMSGKYFLDGNKLILDFGNANKYLYQPQLGDSITILNFYNKKTAKPQWVDLDVYYGTSENSKMVSKYAVENDTIRGIFDSIVCTTLLTDKMVIYPQNIGYEIDIYLFFECIPHSAPYWIRPQWRICSRNKLSDPNRLFVRSKRNIYKRK